MDPLASNTTPPMVRGERIKCVYRETLQTFSEGSDIAPIFTRVFVPLVPAHHVHQTSARRRASTNSNDNIQNGRRRESKSQYRGVKRALLLLHGLHEHSGVYLHVVKHLVEQGDCLCIAVDIHGHGNSHPRDIRGYLPDISLFVEGCRILWNREMAVDTLLHKENIPHFIFGHSLGGLIALHLTHTHPTLFRGALLSAPAIAIKLLPQAGWNRYIAPVVPERIERPIKNALEWSLTWTRPMTQHALQFLDKSFPKMLFPPNLNPCLLLSQRQGFLDEHFADPLLIHGGMPVRTIEQLTTYGIMFGHEMIHHYRCPFLVMHGTEDGLADVGGSRRLHDQSPSRHKTLVLYQGYWHEILQEEPFYVVVNDMIQWMKSVVTDDPRAARSYIHNVDFFAKT